MQSNKLDILFKIRFIFTKKKDSNFYLEEIRNVYKI